MTRAIVSTVGFLALMAVAFFVPAGSWHSPTAWAVLIFFALYSIAALLWLDRGLIDERTSVPLDTRGIDLLLAGPMFIFLLPGTFMVCGFDARFGWSPRISMALQWLAVGVFALGYCFSLWAAHTNRFFSTVVRIQRERGHHLIDTGPYALVRHPGYAGPLIGHAALPIALGSLWGLLPAVVGIVFMGLRTRYEESRLAAELPGYSDYMQRVRWRLLPGLW